MQSAQDVADYIHKVGIDTISTNTLSSFFDRFGEENHPIIKEILDELTAREISTQPTSTIYRTNVKIPKPRNLVDIFVERLGERELEAIAPSTGWPDLDNIIIGFIPGHVYTLTGLESIGKTSIACNFAVNVAKQRKNVLYLALEPENQVIEYIASVRTGKPFRELTSLDIGGLDWEWEYIDIYGKEEVDSLDKLVSVIEKSPKKYDLIIADHFGYFTGGTDIYSKQFDALKILAGIAKKKMVAIVLIAHLRKIGHNQRKNYIPTSDDISGSGAFKQDSTEVMILTKQLENPDNPNSRYTNDGVLYVTKTKCGPIGSIDLKFYDKSARIDSVGKLLQEKQKQSFLQTNIQHKLDDNWVDNLEKENKNER